MLPRRTVDVVAYARVRERAERRAFERKETQPWTGMKYEYMVRTAAAVCLTIVDMAVQGLASEEIRDVTGVACHGPARSLNGDVRATKARIGNPAEGLPSCLAPIFCSRSSPHKPPYAWLYAWLCSCRCVSFHFVEKHFMNCVGGRLQQPAVTAAWLLNGDFSDPRTNHCCMVSCMLRSIITYVDVYPSIPSRSTSCTVLEAIERAHSTADARTNHCCMLSCVYVDLITYVDVYPYIHALPCPP